jgi:histidinol-phosphate aminotransferase
VPFRSDWSLDDRFLEPADDLRLVFLPNPNSPSGTLIEPEIVREAARRIPCPLLVDEAYAEFSRTHCVSLVRENERVMVSRSLSKSYALAGLRFGYIVAQPQIIRGLIKVKDSYNCDALSIAAATAAIDDQAWLAENLRRVLATRARLTSGLRELGFDVVESQANFVWCTHPAAGAFDLYERLKAEGILVRYMKYEGWGDGLRITVGGEGEIEVCLERLQSAVQQAGAGEHTHDQ